MRRRLRAGTLEPWEGAVRLFRLWSVPGEAGGMNASFLQPSARKDDDAAALHGAAARQAVLTSPSGVACCCVARAVVRVVMPPTPARPHETELLLCGHHYRVSRHVLAAAHARVIELPGTSADTTAWIHDDCEPSLTPSR